ncbi:hypothetical protein J2D73_12540 [Acetobacter sacchari]|uniref:Uncharacterized protein n=1 Tax=Acetobacter sacchari TaxID=2661687 RepID=A0ABS3LXN0_9PROT|nr:hypothetical protein [Acetobacter sacchari]MBO1360616.1 hypothetical protein [Acetobacter sacchari]
MRRLLAISTFLLCAPAFGQTRAAAPVEAFSYGQRVGTSSNPLIAALSSAIPTAGAATQAGAPVELFSYGQRVGTQANPLYVNLGSALDAYVKSSDLTATLSSYETSAHAAATYLPLAGGTMTGPLRVESLKYAALPSPCSAGSMVYVTDATKIWGTVSKSNTGTNIYLDTSTSAATNAGMLAVCTSNSSGTLTWLPIVLNTSTMAVTQ